MDRIYIGIDIGSISINVAVLNDKSEVLNDWYVRTEGKPLEKVYALLKEIIHKTSDAQLFLSATGSGGRLLADILDIPFINEVIAQSTATGYLYPDVKTIIEIGGEDSKFISMGRDNKLNVHIVNDFAMNTICAAGTGSFLDQQAARLGLTIEQFSELGLKCPSPPRIAGRCSVFANTDMIHLQQEATPIEDIVAGLCFALARNFKSVIAKGKKFMPLISFQGGVAYNRSMARAFKETLDINPEDLIIPKYPGSMGAIGCALLQILNPKSQIPKLEKIQDFLANRQENYKPLKPLAKISTNELNEPNDINELNDINKPKLVWLGIDIGSISTNLVLIDSAKKLIARKYLWTSGKPIEAVLRGLKEIGEEVGDKVEVKGVGTTGSGRYMISDLIGGDMVKNEITSQARASIEIDPTVDTIFEIGGQDSKYISLQNGVIVDFEMNKVCAAGTGSFLEEQAERLKLNICDEFADCAFKGTNPVNLGERCTVFMQSNLTSWLQKGVQRENLAAGLAYSIAYNYLHKVVGNKKIGNNIFFQGAVAFNQAIVAAFQELLGSQKIRVPPNNDVTGAIGVAIITMEHKKDNKSKFKGFNLYEKSYNIDRFECNDCPNHCEIKEVNLEDDEPLFYGSRCEKYEKRQKAEDIRQKTNLFKVREELLIKSLKSQLSNLKSQVSIGIPRTLIFYEYLPFWVTFFQELGCKVVLSTTTNNKIIHDGCEHTVSDHCFPIKAAHGHILELINKKVDYLFLPSIINMPSEYKNILHSYACPYIQAAPYVIKAALMNEMGKVKLLTPTLYLRRGIKHIEQVMAGVGKTLGKRKSAVVNALACATTMQNEFYDAIKQKGVEILNNLHEPAIVIVGRPYNTCDAGLNLNIPKILSDLNILAIPMDFLDIKQVDFEWNNMYWKYGQKILSTAKIIRENPNLYPLYITNFGCGPDSFNLRFFEHTLANKPALVIEVDEHSAPAGVITRCEAFLDSIKNKKGDTLGSSRSSDLLICNEEYQNRTLLIPFMGNHSYVIASVFKHYNIDARVMPIADAETVELGRKYTTGKECFPCIITTGDMIKTLQSNEFEREKIAFFMPEASGPCRFGQYNKLHRMILKELGYEDIPIVSPNQAKDLYLTLRKYGKEFEKLAWLGLCAVDSLDKLARATRPYEINKGETDQIYNECLDLICKEIEGKRGVGVGPLTHPNPWVGNAFMPCLLKKVKTLFETIQIKYIPKPLIGITGEIYIRSHHFSNANIVNTIEELGGEVMMSTVGEWFFYTNFRRQEDSIVDRKYKELLMYWLKGVWQYWTEHRIVQQIGRSAHLVKHIDEPKVKELFRYSAPYLHRTIEGEAVLTIGKCVDFIKKGANGIITVMPFTCMPGTNVTAIMERIKKVPYLNIAYDGLEQATTQTRLEAFMYQAHQYRQKK
ncbi:MAG: CoA activase [Candidatus Stahlbacteria bacterium]|nr:CoA activase [Candidatus Stahlbacteria bacterium]